jgi:protein-disulfide isomerase
MKFNFKISKTLSVLLFILILCSCATKPPHMNSSTNTANNEVAKLKEINNTVTQQKPSLRPVRPIDSTDHIRGDSKAPIQLIVYSDFECPFCTEFEKTIKKAQDFFLNQIAVAFRHNPLRTHPYALTAALASECAAEQGKFWEMHDKFFTDNESGLNPDKIKNAAKDIQLDLPKFNQCLATEKYKDKIQRESLEAINTGALGTPGPFINGQALIGAVPFEDYTASDGNKYPGLKTIITNLLEKKIK